MAQSEKQRLDRAHIARDRIFDQDASGVRRYAEMVIGEFSIWKLVRYELIVLLIIPVPGALGLALRRLFCPGLFRRVGRSPVFGVDIVLRNTHRISLGDNVVIDAGSLLDGRGAGEDGIEIGDSVIVHRSAVITSKGGGIRIGNGVDIGSNASLVSQNGIEIGDSVSIAGGCRIGGGLVEHTMDRADEDKSGRRYSRGSVRIGNSVTVFQNAMILDGVEVGEGAVIGAGALVRDDVPANTTFAPTHRALMIPHSAGAPAQASAADSRPAASWSGSAAAIVDALLGAVAELNETRSADNLVVVSPETALLGGSLDSLDLVNFIAGAELRLEQLGIHVDLADAMTVEPSPLRTVGALGDFLARSNTTHG
jgi:acetyltransferase-like isoleucine patch superfamily enzyme